MTARGESDGFTLIEALIALALLAVSAVSLLAATRAHVERVSALEMRALAPFAAENLITELELGTSENTVETGILGHDLTVTARHSPTADPDLERVDVTVEEPATGVRFGGFIGFIETARAR